MRNLLAREIKKAGGLRAFGRLHHIDPTFLGRVRDGEKPLSPGILAAIKVAEFVTLTTYIRIK